MLLTTFIINEALSHYYLILIKTLNSCSYIHFTEGLIESQRHYMNFSRTNNKQWSQDSNLCLVLNSIIFPHCLMRDGVSKRVQQEFFWTGWLSFKGRKEICFKFTKVFLLTRKLKLHSGCKWHRGFEHSNLKRYILPEELHSCPEHT